MEVAYLSFVGLVLIALGWVLQFLHLSKGKKEIIKALPAVGAVGIALLVINSYLSGAMDIFVGNLLTLIGSLLVLWKIK
ncbi:MAG: hypothetical protein PHS02_03450 [Candidatus ainarchaeum sp.]|nr:hypothetical protein [Candidatus ainarchaeum sp.]